jgi:hypothetical protein
MPNELAEAITEFIWLIKTLMTRCSGAVAEAACLHVLSFAKHVRAGVVRVGSRRSSIGNALPEGRRRSATSAEAPPLDRHP